MFARVLRSVKPEHLVIPATTQRQVPTTIMVATGKGVQRREERQERAEASRDASP